MDFIDRMIGRDNRRIAVVTGHYGSGKSCFSVNLASDLKRRLQQKGSSVPVAIADLDIVNPYFRSADSAQALRTAGVDVIIQQFANTNVDIPSIPAELNRVFERDGFAVFDIGGDDSGASVLGGISDKIKAYTFRHFYVVNFKRPLSGSARDAYVYAREIEKRARLPVTDLVNNTNLGEETRAETLSESVDEAKKLALALGLARDRLYHSYVGEFPRAVDGEVYAMRNYTKRYF